MASTLPFNQVKVGASVVAAPADFVFGSGNYQQGGEDSAATTADGRIHNFRAGKTVSAAGELKGNKNSIATAYPGTSEAWPSLPTVVTLELVPTSGGTPEEVAVINGVISCEYDSKSGTTKLDIKGSV